MQVAPQGHPQVALQGCRYLKKRCDFTSTHKSHKIKALYSQVTSTLLDQKKPIAQQSLTNNNKLQYIFVSLRQKFEERQQKQFLCSKTFQNTEEKYFPVFKCYECGLEQNAICCVECFDMEKHKDHHYQLMDINGGCCDCGDDSKWDKKGFCKKHTIDEEQEDIDEDQVQPDFFQDFCNHCLLILCKMYQAYKSKHIEIVRLQQKTNEDLKKRIQTEKSIGQYILKIVDTFGYHFMKTLVTINKNRFHINKITRQWMDTTLKTQHKLKYINDIPIKYIVLRFCQLKLSGKALVELYLILFNRTEGWRRDITKEYFKLLSDIPTYIKSSYNDFSPQLFSSSKLILELLLQREIKPLTYKKFISNSKYIKLQDEIKSLNDDYKRFLRDLNYLIEVKQETFRSYWLEFTQSYGFDHLINYEEVFNEKPQYLQLSHKLSFFLEELTLQQIIKVIDKMNGDRTFIIENLKKLTSKLYSLYEKGGNRNFQQNNLFFTYQRIWTIFLFAYFYCYKQKKDCFKSREKEIQEHQLKELLDEIYSFQKGPKDIKEKIVVFSRLLQNLMKELLKRFYNMSHIMKSNFNIKQNMSFAMSYYKGTNLVYSVDAFLLKMITVLQARIPKQCISQEKRKFLKQNKNLTDQIEKYLQKIDHIFMQQISKFDKKQQKKKALMEIQNLILCFQNFFHMICQSLYFNYQDLVILSKFKNLFKGNETENKHKYKFIEFYKIIHNIWCQKDRIDSLAEFKDTFQSFFFKDTHFFQDFINSLQQKDKNESNDQLPINLQYFFVLRYKFSSSNYSTKFIRKVSFRHIPIQLKREGGMNIITSTSHLQNVKSWLEKAIRYDQCHHHIINNLVKELFKVWMLTWAKNYHEYFNGQEFNNLYVERRFQEGIQKLSVYSFLNLDVAKDVQVHRKDYILLAHPSNNRDQSDSFSQYGYQVINEYRDQLPQLQNQNNINGQSRNKTIKNPMTFQVNLGLQIQKTCMLGQDCLQKNAMSMLYQVCFINITNMYGIFQMDKFQKYLCFSTCGHLIHEKCYHHQMKNNSSKILKCKKCKKTYNFIILSLDSYDSIPKQSEDKKKQLIIKDFQNIKEYLASQKDVKSIEVQILKAIMVFLISSVTIDNFNLLRKPFMIYKNLFSKFYFLYQKQKSINIPPNEKNLKAQKPKYPKNNNDFLLYIWERVSWEFNISVRNLQEINKNYESYSKQVVYINQILNFFRTQTKKWKIKDPSQYFLQCPIQKINLNKFPTSLVELNQKRTCWRCRSKKRHSYYICLSHSNNQIEDSQYCVCFMCVNDWVKQHLMKEEEKDHMNECMMIRTDTGQIYYFYLEIRYLDRTQLWCNIEDSVYLNKTMNFYEVGKKYKIEDFTLNQQKVKSVLNQLRSWNQILHITPA